MTIIWLCGIVSSLVVFLVVGKLLHGYLMAEGKKASAPVWVGSPEIDEEEKVFLDDMSLEDLRRLDSQVLYYRGILVGKPDTVNKNDDIMDWKSIGPETLIDSCKGIGRDKIHELGRRNPYPKESEKDGTQS